jgi:hypothetical protein
MMYFEFDKDFAKSVLDAIHTGKPLPAPPEGWTGKRMAAVTGILYAVIWTQGPQNIPVGEQGMEKLKRLHPEYREAMEETLHQDIHDAIEFLSTPTFQILDDEYDEHCEPKIEGIVYRKADGSRLFVPLRGFKGQKNFFD